MPNGVYIILQYVYVGEEGGGGGGDGGKVVGGVLVKWLKLYLSTSVQAH